MEGFRPLEELTLMDDYMFSVVMEDSELLKELLERILDMNILSVQYVEAQRNLKERYAAKGVRLDLYVEDDRGEVYNVEVQTTDKRNLPKRMRYYQSIIDVNILSPGADYRALKKCFVIFLCNYDPFGQERFIYRFENRCKDDLNLPLGDETEKVVVNTRGVRGDISDGLRETIKYLATGTVTGAYSDRLDRTVNDIKQSEERRHEYMVTMIREMEIRAEAREQEGAKITKAMLRSGMSVEDIAKLIDEDVSLVRKWCEADNSSVFQPSTDGK
jgi:predicted transposase/invertase (TIGR01784 family)